MLVLKNIFTSNKIKIILFFLLFTINLFSQELKKLDLQLHWKHQFQYAGFYAAIEKGYYKDIGIDLKIREWNPSINRINDLINQKTTFTISGSDKIAEIINSKKILILSSYLQKTPVALVVKPDIYFPSDLVDKKIVAIENDINSVVFKKMWESSNIDTKKLNIIPHNFNLEPFINNEVDAIQIYLTDQLFQLASNDIKFNILDTNSYGVTFYDLITLTNKKFAQENPKLVNDFRKATKKGWLYALENKEEISNLILKKYNTQNKTKDELLFEAKRLESFILREQYPLGSIDKHKIQQIAQIHLNAGNIDSIENIDDIIFKEDTLGELQLSKKEKEYLEKKKLLKICSVPNKLKLKNENLFKSIGKNIINKISKQINIEIEYIETKTYVESIEFTKNGKCDLLTLTRETKKRKKDLIILKPYVTQPLVLVTSTNTIYIDDIKKLSNKKFAILHEHIAKEEIQKKYPNFKIVEVDNPGKGLQMVQKNEVFAYIDIPIVISHSIKQTGIENLKIAANLDIISGFGFSVNKNEPLLANILNKSLNNISNKYILDLINKWYAVKYEKGIDHILIWKIIFIVLAIVLLIIYWNAQTQNANLKLKNIQKELNEKNNELEKLSSTDHLTKLYNRHKTDEVLIQELHRFNRYNSEFGVIMIDIDYFKIVNDQFGHQVGDEILIEFSNILKSKVRKTDVIGRWGGEEFLIICTNTNKEALIKVAEKCKYAIEKHTFPYVKNKTASFGLSVISKEKSIEQLVKEADENLYIAKETGRNKIVY